MALAAGPRTCGAQELPGIASTPADSLRGAAEPGWRWGSPLGDLRLRGDFLRDLPGGRADFERLRSFLRLGGAVFPLPELELGAAFEAALGSDHNSDNLRNNDNEQSDGFGLDLLYARWQVGADVMLSAGRRMLPLALTALVWDDDLRPVGGALAARLPFRDFDAWRLAAGGFGVRSLADSWVRLWTVQAAFSFQDGGPRGADVRLALLHWEREDALVADGLSRTNATREGEFVADFELLDLQLVWRTTLGGLPWRAQVEWVENLGAETQSTGLAAELAAGDLLAPGHLEIKYRFHRIEQDAVLAAFNSDDWWFHSRMRGHRARIAVALVGRTSLGVSGSVERRDDLSTWTKRLLLDLQVAFSS